MLCNLISETMRTGQDRKRKEKKHNDIMIMTRPLLSTSQQHWVVNMSNWSLYDHFWEENWLEWKHKWERQTSYNKWWYRIQNRSTLLYSYHKARTKAHAWPAVCPVVRLTWLVGRLSEVFDEEDANQASNTCVQHSRWPEVWQWESWG